MNTERFVRRTSTAGRPGGREFSLDWGDQSRLRELRIWHTTVEPDEARAAADSAQENPSGDAFVGSLESSLTTIAALQFAWELDDGTPMISPVIGAVPFDHVGRALAPDDHVRLGDADIINGIHGHAGAGRVNALGLITQFAQLDPLGSTVGVAFSWTLADMSAAFDPDASPKLDVLPPDSLICGVYGHTDTVGLRSIGLRCSVPGPGPALLIGGPGGRLVPTETVGRPPSLAEAPTTPSELDEHAHRPDHTGVPTPAGDRPNPNYESVVVRRLDQWDDELRIHSTDGLLGDYRFVTRRIDHERRRVVDVYPPIGETADGPDEGAVVEVYPETAHADLRIELPNGVVLTPPAVPQPAASDGPTWDNVFGLDRRVDYLAWSTRGIDVSRIGPFNLQEATGALRGHVFGSPAPGSRDFHIADNGEATVVPNGWSFVGDVAGNTRSRTVSAFSDEESRRSWATSLGISADAEGLGAKIAYKNNSKAHSEVSSGSSGKIASTIVEHVEIDHALVVDHATVELSHEFRRAVEELATDPSTDRIAEFLRRFGTHYARAVTFGSKTWEQRHETEESIRDSMTHGSSRDQSVEVGYKNEVAGGSASVSWGSQGESSSSTKRGTGLEVSSQGSIGSATEPVPIMLQLEDVVHLLNPVFFDDPYVYIGLRTAVNEFLDEFPTENEYDDVRGTISFDIAPADFSDGDDGSVYRFAGREFWIHGGQRFQVEEAVSTFLPRARDWTKIASLTELFPASPHGATSEGKLVRTQGNDGAIWWLRGGRRHRLTTSPSDAVLVYFNERFTMIDEVMLDQHYPDSGRAATLDGRMIRRWGSREVWWLKDGQAHRVPSEAVVDVLGGWELVAAVNDGMFDRVVRSPATEAAEASEESESQPTATASSSHRFTVSKVVASVEGKMFRTADSPDVWVIHERERHRIPNEPGIVKRGGWQNVAIVRHDVVDWFPDSPRPAS